MEDNEMLTSDQDDIKETDNGEKKDDPNIELPQTSEPLTEEQLNEIIEDQENE